MSTPRSSTWLELASESLASATDMVRAEYPRSAASRYYYAAYQAAHAVVLSTPLRDGVPRRGNWDHGPLANALFASLTGYLGMSDGRAVFLRTKLVGAFHARAIADYRPSVDLEHRLLMAARDAALSLVRLASRREGN